MDKGNNVIQFEEAIRKKQQKQESETSEFNYNLTVDDARALFRVLNFIRELSVDGSLTIDIEDDVMSLTKTNNMFIHEYEFIEDDVEEVREYVSYEKATANFSVDWEGLSSDDSEESELSGVTALCDCIFVIAGSNDGLYSPEPPSSDENEE